jgi:uncharacterized repeat protein (TIGR03803 family)
MTRKQFLFVRNFAVCLAAFTLASAKLAAAQTETVIHSFQSNSVTDGAMPIGGLVADQMGALYGTTFAGGKYNGGTVFKLAPPAVQGGVWKQNILYSFTGGPDSGGPWGTLVLDSKSGKIFGGTDCPGCSGVFELSPPAHSGLPWNEIMIYSSAQNGVFDLIADREGKLYGTTNTGGRYKAGSVFVLSFSGGVWKEQDIYSFTSVSGSSAFPGGLAFDSAGVLYGVTAYGGGNNAVGSLFSLTPPAGGSGAWTENILYSFFPGENNGFLPGGALTFDSTGAIYGTTAGGTGNVFQLVPPSVFGGLWTENVLYTFQGNGDGLQPQSGVIFDGTGALYGTAPLGGDLSCGFNGIIDGCGTIFKLAPPSAQGGTWTEQTLHEFTGFDNNGSDGVEPGVGAPFLAGSTLYGTTLQGGDPQVCFGPGDVGCGTVYMVTLP